MVTRRPPPVGSRRPPREALLRHPGRRVPPTFFISVNQPKAVGAPYRRYLVNQLREVYGFAGSPIRVVLRPHQKPARTVGPALGDAPH